MEAPKRPLLRYHGAKWRLGPWIINHFPEHTYYAEPFGGSAAVMLRKERAYGEYYNDLYSDLITFFRVLQVPAKREELAERVALTPFARAEFDMAFERASEDIEIARRLIIRSHMGFGSAAYLHTELTGFRHTSKRAGTLPSHDWMSMPRIIRQVGERFEGVTIDSRNALDFMRALDGPDVLFYVDPPYLKSTRTSKRWCYIHEMDEAEHVEMLSFVCECESMVALSAYQSDLYDDMLGSWHKVEKMTSCSANKGGSSRTEVLWLNEACVKKRDVGTLFAEPTPQPKQGRLDL